MGKRPDRTFYETAIGLATVLAAGCALIDLLIAFVFVKYKKLRLEKSNIIILNYVVIDSLCMILLVMVNKVENIYHSTPIVFAILAGIELILMTASVLIIALLTVHWYVKLYHPDRAVKLNKCLKWILICIYIVVLVVVCCIGVSYFWIYAHVLPLLLVLFMLFMVVINIVHFINKGKLNDYKMSRDYPFLLSNAYFLSKLPGCVVGILFVTEVIPFSNYVLEIIVEFFIIMLAFIDAVYFFMILYICNNDFSSLLRNMLSCKRTVQGEIVEQPVKYVERENLVQGGVNT